MRSAVLLALAACGDNIELDPNVARSGLRIKLVRYAYEDGTRELETRWFHDAARDERCTPRMWSDGVTLCTPEFTDTVFPTSECARALGRVPAGDSVPPYFVRQFYLAGTWVPSRIYRPGERAEVPAQAWELREGACLGPYEVAGYDYYELGSELERSSLVRITHPEIEARGDLAHQVLASDDGLYAPVGLRDTLLETACAPAAVPGAGSTMCVPATIASAEYFHDEQCASPELAVAPGESLPPVIRYRDAASSCTSYHAVGAAVDAPPLFHKNGPSCVTIAAPSSYRYYLAGPPHALPRLDRADATRGTRLAMTELVHGDLRIADPLLYDHALATECRRGELDGELRCVPETTAEMIKLFSDDACQTTVPVASVATGSCASHAAFALAPGRVFHAIGAVHAAPLYHPSTGDRCLPYTSPAGIAMHDVGPALHPATFATATVVVDP